jgi:uncharacterized protein (TIGR02453 family)
MPFSGFSRTVRFLAELSRNNERAWFEAHRAEYEDCVVEPAKAFVEALGPRLRALEPKIQAVPRLNGSIKALERRMRFSRGAAAPYKDYLDVWFWAGKRRAWENSGFFLRLGPERLVLAAGMVEFQKEMLALYRQEVLDEARGTALAEVVATVRAHGYLIGGESYKKAPRGVPGDHPRAELTKHGGLFASLDGAHPSELGSASFVDYAASHFSRMAPLHTWLAALGGRAVER